MRLRRIIHVAGAAGTGKTMFIERALASGTSVAACARCVLSPKARGVKESKPKQHAELQRYRRAGACDATLYQFKEPSCDDWYMSQLMEGYSEVVYIEGDCPTEYVELSVAVASIDAERSPLLERRLVSARERPSKWADIGDDPSRMLASLLDLVNLAPKSTSAKANQAANLLRELQGKLKDHAPAPVKRWAITPHYAGIERAQLVVFNVRTEEERVLARAHIDDLHRIRKEQPLFDDIVRPFGNRTPITAVAADLSDAADQGLKRALARLKRAAQRPG
ncbi:MAG: hypothetical protein R3F49_06825 [Planctomycetota bacterium]